MRVRQGGAVGWSLLGECQRTEAAAQGDRQRVWETCILVPLLLQPGEAELGG